MRVLAHHQKRRAETLNHARHANHSSNGPTDQVEASNTQNEVSMMIHKTYNALESRSDEGDFVSGSPVCRSKNLRNHLEQGAFLKREADLILELKSIRRKLNFTSNCAEPEQRPRKRAKREITRCDCHIALWDNREGFGSSTPIASDTQLCFIKKEDSVNGPFVQIEMDEPLRIKATRLLVRESKKEGAKLVVADKIFMEMKIIPRDSIGFSESWPPIPVLRKSDGLWNADTSRRALNGIQGALVSSYTGLPRLPEPNVPLSVGFVFNGKSSQTKFGLEVAASWAVPEIEPFKNRLSKKSAKPTTNHCLRQASWFMTEDISSASDNIDSNVASNPIAAPPKADLTYLFDLPGPNNERDSIRTLDFKGLSCVVCQAREFRSIKDLLFHLMTNHHQYQYMITKEEKYPMTDQVRRLVIKIQPADSIRLKPANDKLGPEGSRPILHKWVAPEEPFDIDAHLNGESSWTGVVPRRRAPNQPTPHVSQPATGQLTRKTVRFLVAEEVPDLNLRKRRQYKIVTCRVVRTETPFFRSISHRVAMLDEDEMSESDNDIDQSWLRDKHRDSINSSELLNRCEKEFMVRWNAHLMSEYFPHGCFIAESLVRFIRKQRTWLKQSSITKELTKHIVKLRQDRLIDDREALVCFRTLHSEDEPGAEHTEIQANVDVNSDNNNTGDSIAVKDVSKANLSSTAVGTTPGWCGICLNKVKPLRLGIVCSGLVRNLRVPAGRTVHW